MFFHNNELYINILDETEREFFVKHNKKLAETIERIVSELDDEQKAGE